METAANNWIKTIPNILTFIRMGIGPVILVLYTLDDQFYSVLCAFLFAIGSATDFFDGYIARKYNSESKLGRVFDPMADKLLSTIAIVLLVSKGHLATYLGALLICREVAISGLRLAAKEDGISLQVSDWGKLKTLILDLSLFCLFINTEAFQQFGLVTAWLALGISYFSAYQYISKFLVQAKA